MPARFTTEKFIEKAKEVHGNRYDYSKVIYVQSKLKVTITCPKHGDFEQQPDGHLKGNGCPKCANENNANMRRCNTQEFIEKAIKVHGDRYDYSKVVYIDNKSKITITCHEHGDFEQQPHIHLGNHGCQKCAKETISNANRSNLDDFIKKSREKYGEKYDYSLVDYKNTTTPVNIICPVHGIFIQTPGGHSQHGCPKCGGTGKLSRDEFIERSNEIYDNKYDYSKSIYTNGRSNIIINCPEHGEFTTQARQHLSGYGGCPTCRKKTTEQFIEEARAVHGDKYDYSKSKYLRSDIPLTIICPIEGHGEFPQTPGSHVSSGAGCPKCKGHIKLTTEEFIERSRLKHGDRYDYSRAEYKNTTTPITIICPIEGHGEFPQMPSNHWNGAGCPVPECRWGDRRSCTKEFIEKAKEKHGDTYDYSDVDYVNIRTPVIIKCRKHGAFLMNPDSHLRKMRGCRYCYNKTEGYLFLVLEELFPHYTIIKQKIVHENGSKSLKTDFFIVELNLHIELDGGQHFVQVFNWYPPELTQAHDLTKTKLLLKEGQSLIRIFGPWVEQRKCDWLDKLKENIRGYENPTLVFIGPEGTYDKHKEDIRWKLGNRFEMKSIV